MLTDKHPEILNGLTLNAELEQWPLIAPFRIAGFTFKHIDVLVISLTKQGSTGRGEAAGVYYKDDRPAIMIQKIESLLTRIEYGLNREMIQILLPPGGARNALDCAFWDLNAKLTNRTVWQIAKLENPRRLLTTFTCGADTPESMAVAARGYRGARAIKLKLAGDARDVARVCAVRAALPDVWIGVDANQGLTRASLEHLLPTLVEARVELIEQPFPVGQEALLDRLESPIPIAADESAQTLTDLASLVDRFDIVNIKLDKSGGLTEALAMAREARRLGLGVMVGNMIGTSLAMAPASLVGQLCDVVDLDGPTLLKADREPGVEYSDGHIVCPAGLWGS
jgi:L-alanine-DL-glutamate epimerase-like enolase superfamily enzyme